MFFKPFHQTTYTIDSIPAYKYGEWPGIKSSHWNSSLRVYRRNIPSELFTETSTNKIFPRRIQQKYSLEEKYRPGKNILPQRPSLTDPPIVKKEGKKRINIIYPEIKSTNERRHYSPKFGFEKIPEPPFQIKTFRPDGNYCTDKETLIEKELGGKMRIWNIFQQRNNFLLKNPGDKSYNAVEYLPNFFLDGGLIPGSTNTINNKKNHSKKANDFYDTLNLNCTVLSKDKLWKSKEKKDILDFDKNYVSKTISSWETSILKEFDPSYLKTKNEEEKEKKK